MSDSVPVAGSGDSAPKNEKKWGKTVMRVGYVIVPSVLLKGQRALGLDSIDLNILLHLMVHWWEAEKLPYLGKKKIAELMKVDESTVRRRIQRMEKAGLISRKRRREKGKGDLTNAIDFSGLVAKAQDVAKPMADDIAAQRAKRERRPRKNPTVQAAE